MATNQPARLNEPCPQSLLPLALTPDPNPSSGPSPNPTALPGGPPARGVGGARRHVGGGVGWGSHGRFLESA